MWEEAGIAPSLRTRLVVELFHRLAMGEEAEAAALARALARAPGDDAPCLVVDPAGLRRAARDLGIRTAGRTDEVIASAVVEAVIDEYTPRHSTTPE